MFPYAALPRTLPPDLFSPRPVEIHVSERDGIRVEWRRQELDQEGQVARFTGGIRATYGPTVVEAEELVLNYRTKVGEARGRVRITDPDGFLEADDLKFNWEQRTGEATQVSARIVNMRLSIERVEITPDRWILHGVRGTPSRTSPPEFEIGARRLTLQPGRSGRASHPSMSLFGFPLGSVPHFTFSLDRRVQGFRLPAISFRRGQGIGFAWSSMFLLGEDSSLVGKLNVLPRSFPSIQVEYARSLTDSRQLAGRLATRTELADRLSDSYFDSVLVRDPAREVRALRAPRNMVSVGSYWAQSTRGRALDVETVSKPVDLVWEVGGRVGKGGVLGQTRLQRVRGDRGEPFIDRGVLQWVAHSGAYRISPRLDAFLRADGLATLDADRRFGWKRTSVFGRYTVDEGVFFTAGVGKTFEFGTERFEWDRLFIRDSAHLRLDYGRGPYRLSALVKYDLERRDWSSVEYGVSFVAGAFEPYLNYRQVPRELQFGVRLRMNEFFDRLSERELRRASPTQAEGAQP